MIRKPLLALLAFVVTLGSAHPDFQKCIKFVSGSEQVPLHPSVQLEVYGLYKQALFGDCQGGREETRDPVAVEKAKAWMSRSGMSKEAAQSQYVALIDRLAPDWRSKV